MGWLFRTGSTRRELIAERTKDWATEGAEGITIASKCLAHCYRGNVYSGLTMPGRQRSGDSNGPVEQDTC